jgi:hypothetical protein
VENRDTLLSIAEIAVSLAGFTGLVGVLGRRGEDTSSGLSWIRLRAMLEVALRNAAFALLPLPFLGVVSSETAIWRISSGIYLVTVVAYILYRRRRTNPSMAGQALGGPLLSLLPISLLACLANVLGLAGPYAFSLYLLSLLLGLVSAGMLFLSVAATIFHDEQP